MIQYFASTRKGCNHFENQDRVLIDDRIISDGVISGHENQNIFAGICDGVGGCNGGATAAQTVAEIFSLYRRSAYSESTIRRAALAANDELAVKQQLDQKMSSMCSTAIGICINGSSVTIFNIGDSRIYRISKQQIELLTEDASLAWQLYSTGRISDPRNAPSSYRRTIKQYLGGSISTCMPEFCKEKLPPSRCTYLICSDGVWGKISDPDILSIAQSTSCLEKQGKLLIETAYSNGSSDDLSVVLISCGSEGAQN